MEKDTNIEKQEFRIMEMGRMLSCIFLNYHRHKEKPKELIKEQFRQCKGLSQFCGEITPSDIVEFMTQVGDEILKYENE